MTNRRWLAAFMLGALLVAFWSGTKYEAWREKDNSVEIVGQIAAIDTLQDGEPEQEAQEPGILVHVTGAVEHSGVYELKRGQRVEDALALAGVRSDAAIDSLNRAALLSDGQKIVVPVVGEVAASDGSAPLADAGVADGRISINQADLQTLMRLPGIGEVKAQAIIDYRTAHGGFQSLEELKNVKGIGDKTYQGLAEAIML